MSIDEFAEFVGHGASMLKKVEAGTRRMSDELRDKIHAATGVDHITLSRDRLTEKEARELSDPARSNRAPSLASLGGPFDESPFSRRRPFELLPELLALYFLMVEVRVNPRFAAIAIRREMGKTLVRFGLDPVRFYEFVQDFGALLMPANDGGPLAGPIEALADLLQQSKGFQVAEKEHTAWMKRQPPRSDIGRLVESEGRSAWRAIVKRKGRSS